MFMKKTIKQFSLKEITISLLTAMIVLCILLGGVSTAEAARVYGNGGCVHFCGDEDGIPKHSDACCEGFWWYDACGWDSYCSTKWSGYVGYAIDCCEACSTVDDCPNGSECSGEKCIVNKTPIASISIGKTLLGDNVPAIYGYAYDPTDSNSEENVSLEVVYNDIRTVVYGTSYTSKEIINGTCSGLSKKCGFSIAINDTYLHSGNNSIKISAIDPDTDKRILLYDKTLYFRTNISCPSLTSKKIMRIGAYTFGRDTMTETWKGCKDYAIGSHGGSIQYRQYYSVWPSGWSDIKDGSFDGGDNLGIHPHLLGEGNAYTLEMYKNSTKNNLDGKSFSGDQKCSYLIQDYVWSKDIIGDSYWATSNPSCVAIGANETSIAYGEEVNLAWELDNIDSATLTEVGNVSSNGSAWLKPLKTTTYVLTGKIGDIEVEESVTVDVTISCEMSGDPTTIDSGESARLDWSSIGAAYAQIDNGIGEVPVNGSKIVSPAITTTYDMVFGGNNPMLFCGARAHCSQKITVIPSMYSCTGSIPTGYEAHDSEEGAGLTVDTPWTLSATDTATKCQYKISDITYSCTGSIPAGNEAYDSEESTGLTVDTPWTLSATDTATKCE